MYVCRHIFTYVYAKGLRMKAALSTELSDSSKGRADQTSSHAHSTVSSCPTLSPLPQKHLLPRSDPGSHGSGMLETYRTAGTCSFKFKLSFEGS